MGTHAAALAAERELPAIWLTPLLHIPDANHSLRAPGKLRDFTETLGTIGTAIEDFLDSLGH